MAEEYNSQGDNAPERTSKSIRGYQIVIILLVVVLGVLAFIYFRQVKSLKAEAKAEKAILEENINDLIVDLDNLKARYNARHHAPLRQADRFAQPA